MTTRPDSVTVRMYRGILGDCFVLTVGSGAERTITLIDCGVLQNVASGADMLETLPEEVVAALGRDSFTGIEAGNARIKAVAQDVIDYVKGGGEAGRIDLLVATHEHFDHLSGFALARDLWADPSITVDRLWLGWMEKPGDDPALKQLRDDMAASKRAVQRAALAAPFLGAAGQSDEMCSVLGLANFLGPLESDGMGLGGGIPSTSQTLDFLKAKAATIRYCEPGDVIPPEEGAGLKAYVLGPPHNVLRIKKDTPSSGAAKEVYVTSADEAAVVETAALRAFQRSGETQLAEVGPVPAAISASASSEPFAPRFRRPYVFGNGELSLELEAESPQRRAIRELYEQPDAENLRIEEAWLSAAETLALKLDSDTNNTSLVLAFELPTEDRRILLFAADAQVGNWLSWGDQTYPPAGTPASEPSQRIEDLLRRVVFYKVGHHGSHNATLRDMGLELMTDDRLVAAIPVVETVAKIQGKGRREPGAGWQMPYPEMYARLGAKTRGRIVRGDGVPGDEEEAFNQAGDASQVATARHDPGGLWVELSFGLD